MKLKQIFTRALIEIGFFSLCLNLLMLVLPLYLLQIYDRVLPGNSRDTLVYLTIICVIALALLGMLEGVRSAYASRVANQLDAALGAPAIHATINGPNAASSDIQPLRDLMTVRNFVSSRTIFFLFDLPFMPIFLILLYFVHPMLFYVTVAGAAAVVLVLIANQMFTAGQIADYGRKNSESMLLAQAFTRGSETLRALGMTFNAIEQWGSRVAEAANTSDAFQRSNAFFTGLSRTIRMTLQIAILGVGAWLVLKGEMTAGMIFAASIISGRALQPLDQIIGAWRPVQDSWNAWKRIRKMASVPMDRAEGAIELPAPKGEIRFEQVTYFAPNSPPGGEPIVKGINLVIRPGECIGVLGPSRAGKSTLVRLMVGAIRPSHGVVRYDNADINQWIDADRGRHVGYLPQEIEFFPGTIAQNIARFEPEYDQEAVLAAANQGAAHPLIMAQAKNYETLLGPGGARLSGGESQLVGMSRAFYGNPRILVLDEPNANLDADGEAALEKAILEAKQEGLTVVLTTHRLSIARVCDRILVMRGGQIEMFGPAAEVLTRLQGGQPPAANAAEPLRRPVNGGGHQIVPGAFSGWGGLSPGYGQRPSGQPGARPGNDQDGPELKPVPADAQDTRKPGR